MPEYITPVADDFVAACIVPAADVLARFFAFCVAARRTFLVWSASTTAATPL
jgi:hypothetical protein